MARKKVDKPKEKLCRRCRLPQQVSSEHDEGCTWHPRNRGEVPAPRPASARGGAILKLVPKPAVAPAQPTREEWLRRATEALRPVLAEHGAVLPSQLMLSCGWPKGKGDDVIGQCWHPGACLDGKTTHVFISPAVEGAVRVLDILLHELVHAAVGTGHGHKGEFRRVALACGLTGKMTATVAGPTLLPRLEAMAKELGDYPHAALRAPKRRTWKRGATKELRLYSRTIPDYRVYVRRSQLIEHGAPLDPMGEEMITREELEGGGGDDGE